MGVPMGLLLSGISLSMMFSDWVPLLALLAMVLLLAGPVLLFVVQRRAIAAWGGSVEFAGVWLLGIMTVLFGSLICALVTIVVTTTARPGFIYEQVSNALSLYQQMPQLRGSEFVKLMRQALDQGLLPTPMEWVMQMFWLTSFSGSLLSALTAAVARLMARHNGSGHGPNGQQ